MRTRALLAALVLLLTATGVAAKTSLVRFAKPADGAVVTEPRVTVTGQAEPRAPTPGAAFDVVVVMDTSGSTRMSATAAASGVSPTIATGPFGITLGGGPNVLETEVAAARRFVDVADPASTRIGIVTFSEGGGGPRPGNAWVEQPLTSDYGAVRAALSRVAARTPYGGTDMVAGMRLAIRELRALSGTESSPRPDARKVVLFMTDGFPTLPYPNQTMIDERNVTVTLDAARVAAKANIVVHTFCLGREALSAPVVCRDAARITGGKYHPVQRPGDVVELLPATKIGQVDIVSVRNATTGQMARSLDVDASGRFSADVPLAPGANRLVAQVHGADPEAGMATMVVHYRPAGDVDIKVEPPKKPDPALDLKIERVPKN